MTHESAATTAGWILSGYQAFVVLWVWVACVLLYGLWRSAVRPEPDAIRASGPTNL